MNFALATAVGTALIATASVIAQPAQTPLFKAGVEIVRLDVRVSDADGNPIGDLRPDEVQVVEEGQPRPIVLFQHVAEPRDPYVEVAARTMAGEVSTNQGAARGHLYILVFDQQHIAPGGEQLARQAARRFLETRIRPGDRVAIYALPGPGPQVGFTADAKRAAAELTRIRGLASTTELGALASMRPHEAFQIARGNEEILARVAARVQTQLTSDAPGGVAARRSAADFSTDTTPLTDLIKEDARTITNKLDDESRRMLAMLGDVLRSLRDIEGRKAVVFVSEGFYGDRLAREIDEVAAAAAQCYCVFYPVDINERDALIAEDTPSGADQATSIFDKLNTLGTLATATDGLLIQDAAHRADQAFATVAAQSQDYYLVGFMPREEDGRKDRNAYRRIAVRVARPGARVGTRTGFALGDPRLALGRRQAIDRALAAPFPLQALPIEYTTYVLRGSSPGVQRVIVSLSVQLPIASSKEARAADVVYAVRSAATGRVAASGTDLIALPVHADGGGSTGSGAFRVQFDLAAGEYLMRVVVREPAGLVGSADRRFIVPALDGPAVTSGDLILSARPGELPVHAKAYPGESVSGIVDVYGRTPEQLRDIRVQVDLVAVGETVPVATGDTQLLDIRPIGGGAAREVRVELPIEGVATGAYLARATVRSGADTQSQVVREIEVRAGERAASATAAEEAESDVFDPRELVSGDLAREYAARLRIERTPAAADALRGLDRLGASDFAAAIGAFQAALAADPQRAATAFFLGWAFHGAGDDRQAVTAWRRAAYVDPKLLPAHLALAEIYVRMSQPALAVQALRAGLTALPNSVELRERLERLAPFERR